MKGIANEEKTISAWVYGTNTDKYFGTISTRNNLGGVDNSANGYIFLLDDDSGGDHLYYWGTAINGFAKRRLGIK